MVAAEGAEKIGVADKLGIEHDMVVQELGWDEDVDDALRAAVEERCGAELLDEEAQEVIDVVLLWWRDGDGDLTDDLVDAIGPLADEGVIWLLTPKTGRDGYVEPSDIGEAADTAGLSVTSTLAIIADWTATRLVGRSAKKSKS
ncbi:hypothetical protein JOF53_002780 [Crossiella equi]|uniref:DUF3052 domain-containing protein n=1 Tax=Crossiella equi TaxID=130796 RepID=A0ABS5ABF4_9PSEU|nr:DUF3052 domain-containing protein [Crossiella equi]MBP2473908.1 hypothetical protein [Crossiella equi]